MVLDVPRRLGLEHRATILERKLVLVQCGEHPLALCVDDVRDPEELPREHVLPPSALPAQGGALSGALVAVARTSRGMVAVVEPRALASPKLLRQLADAIRGEAAA